MESTEWEGLYTQNNLKHYCDVYYTSDSQVERLSRAKKDILLEALYCSPSEPSLSFSEIKKLSSTPLSSLYRCGDAKYR